MTNPIETPRPEDQEWLRVGESYARMAMGTSAAKHPVRKLALACTAIAVLLLRQAKREEQQ